MDNVNTLLDKAAAQTEAHLAMHFAQAALNAAHALQVMSQIKEAAVKAERGDEAHEPKDGGQ